ncbi:MBL fold metallo-hydrolase [uncultured Pseudacidovorax sp.]|uniref:MBL fold metallo-hydrolase n=1 Tax=uncultured Pseudacidovorax sp. TaxID=679313 RepID=UPI0025E4270D|nr:MBL fold metallo-hydrolase [uncultured Pseudacidovorax sp.]
MAVALPAQVTVFERGWLSSNNVLLTSGRETVLVDTGYCTHAAQTEALVRDALAGRMLDRIINTHLHSDHCGGNAQLQTAYPEVRISIAQSQLDDVRAWNADALTFEATGQQCPRFVAHDAVRPGDVVEMGELAWSVVGGAGHDPHELLLFEPQHRILISADALWQHGYGVVFPELEGEPGFADVAATLDRIEGLAPRVVIPGHGAAFIDVEEALARARHRLVQQRDDPRSHAWHALKVLLKFKLLEQRRIERTSLLEWATAMPYARALGTRHFSQEPLKALMLRAVGSLLKSGAARQLDDWIEDAG